LHKITFITKPKQTWVFAGFFSQLPETRVLKFCPELETLSTKGYYQEWDSIGG